VTARPVLTLAGLLLAATLVGGAGVGGAGVGGAGVGGAGQHGSLPLPPAPPDHLAVAEDAPVPDADARAPVPTLVQGAKVSLEMYRASRFDPSLGFAPGSRFQTAEDRKPIQTPGVSVRIPLK
jgi:hypothetical protein